ncbi:MAG: FHA domain-containing protein [Anaerolineae bacterium]|nr:FHA domain-containing protein [Anaerolineae bacterium]
MADNEIPKPDDEQSEEKEGLTQPVIPKTTLLDDHVPPVMPEDEMAARANTSRLASPWRLLMQIGGENQTTVGIEVKGRIVLGRGDPVANYYPDLDLSPYGGQEGGVSRRHAAIIQDDVNKALYLEDLESTNGTRINGFSLEARRRYRLRDGDELEFGKVQMILRFVRSPYQ